MNWLQNAWISMPPDEQLRTSLQFVAGTITIYLAWRGLSTWKMQLRGQLEAERSLGLLDAFWNCAMAVQNFGLIVSSYQSREKIPPEKQEQYIQRWNQQRKEYSDKMITAQIYFNEEYGKVRALWGNTGLDEEVGKLSKLLGDVVGHMQQALNEDIEFKYIPESRDFNCLWKEIMDIHERVRKTFSPVLPQRKLKRLR